MAHANQLGLIVRGADAPDGKAGRAHGLVAHQARGRPKGGPVERRLAGPAPDSRGQKHHAVSGRGPVRAKSSDRGGTTHALAHHSDQGIRPLCPDQGHHGPQVLAGQAFGRKLAAMGRVAKAALVIGPRLDTPLGPPGPGQPERGPVIIETMQGNDDGPGLLVLRRPFQIGQLRPVLDDKGPAPQAARLDARSGKVGRRRQRDLQVRRGAGCGQQAQMNSHSQPGPVPPIPMPPSRHVARISAVLCRR